MAYVYSGTPLDVQVGDRVKTTGDKRVWVVTSGNGGSRANPSVNLEIISGSHHMICVVSKLTLVQPASRASDAPSSSSAGSVMRENLTANKAIY